jgi:general secretion pathway protein L
MARLLLQFSDAEFEHLRWVVIDEEQAMADLSWQSASSDELASLAAQNPHPVIILIPQQCVYLTQVELPERASRQILAAIEFQIEDRLAQDIESQHFAIADAGQNPVIVAVVSRSIMDRCLQLAASCNLRLAQIVPELFLCPWPGDGVNLMHGDDGILVRYGEFRGLKCQPSALPAMLDLIRREVEFDKVRYFETVDHSAPELEQYEVELPGADSARLGLVGARVIDLQQRDYQVSSVWRGIARTWRWVAVLLVALLVVGGYNRFIALQELEREIASVRAAQYEVVKLYLPAGTRPEDDLKRRLLERLKQQQVGANGQGFMQLLAEFSRAQRQFSAVNVDRIGYQNSALNIDLTSAQLKDIEALHSALQEQGVEARLENLNIKPELISGRLVMGGGSSG